MRIVFIHYRLGGTDGVSLEIEKRKKILEGLGHKVFGISGQEEPEWACNVIEELSITNEQVLSIKKGAFECLEGSVEELVDSINGLSTIIANKLSKVITNYDVVFLHNFSHGRHIAAAIGFQMLQKLVKIPKVIATHHDFWYERSEYKPTCREISSLLESVPPQGEQINHFTISINAQRQLLKLKGIDSGVMTDSFDFDQPIWMQSAGLTRRLSAYDPAKIVLHATRIVRRKGIELAIDLVAGMNRSCPGFVLVLSGQCESESRPYLQALRKKAAMLNVVMVELDDLTREEFFQMYVHCALVTFTSLWEGWGNQFIEAVFARKPIVIFEYPVYQTDIKPYGYEVVSLGSEYTTGPDELVSVDQDRIDRAVDEVLNILKQKDVVSLMTTKNFDIGSRYHSTKSLEEEIVKVLPK